MHELSLCQQLLAIVQEQALLQGYRRIKTIYLAVGTLALLEKSAMNLSFDVCAKGTIAEGAELKYVDVPATATCQACQLVVTIHQRYQACPYCHQYLLHVQQGNELIIKAMEAY
ncbi:MAG: hydrogenase maturation nickel metallochaperone HypA [Coxiellaceae bacterium]|nr:MAG: hydrogenase maturation nickel metallochaperone HypA [Coxiellaceae bacterium]